MSTNSKGPTFENKPKQEPALYRYACAMYEAMQDEAGDRTVEGVTYRVYEGFITKTWQRVSSSNNYMSQVISLLEEYNCIATITKGVRNSPSEAALLRHPDEAEIPDEARILRKNGRKPLTSADDVATLSHTVKSLAAQVGGVSLPELVLAIEARLKEIEGRLDALEGKER